MLHFFLFFIFINIVSILLLILLGGILPLFERKYLSLIQRRVGPKFIGYNGRLQFLADSIKILIKEIIEIKNINKLLHFLFPLLLVFLNVFFLLNIMFFNNTNQFNSFYSVIVIFIIELLNKIILTMIGLFSKNKYTTIASTRIINATIVTEIFVSLTFLIIYLNTNSLNINDLLNNTIFFKFFFNIIFFPFLFVFIILILNKAPFDIIEAETELIMGVTTEYSGFLSGSLILVEYLHLFTWSYIFIFFLI